MAFISAETGTLVFAIINLVLVFGSLIVGIGFVTCWGLGYFIFISYSIQNIMIGISLLGPFIGLIFSSFLLNGILKKIPEHIKAYFAYGIINIPIALLVLLTIYLAGFNYGFKFYFFFLCIIILYCLMLDTIRKSYLKMQQTAKQTDINMATTVATTIGYSEDNSE